jgi:hypothetical protein
MKVGIVFLFCFLHLILLTVCMLFVISIRLNTSAIGREEEKTTQSKSKWQQRLPLASRA